MTTTKTLTRKDAIKYLTLHDPDLTNAQIQTRLQWLGLPPCTTFLIAQIRGGLRDDVRFMKKVGLLRNKPALIPSCIRNLKPPKEDRYHFGRQSRDD